VAAAAESELLQEVQVLLAAVVVQVERLLQVRMVLPIPAAVVVVQLKLI
jgi:hypothetical protein